MRETIAEITNDITLLKALKKEADEKCDLTLEYTYHTDLQYAKKALKRFVAAQMVIKGQLRDEYAKVRGAKRQWQIGRMIRDAKIAAGEL